MAGKNWGPFAALRRTWVLFVIAMAVVIAPRSAQANQCIALCDQAYTSCGELKAAGCSLAGAAAGQLMNQAASQIPIPGAGALFGAATKSMTAAQCEELLEPCKAVRNTCYEECGFSLGANGQMVAVEATASKKPKSTLRIFADQPRTLVYLNGQRMGATPEDPLEPFVTPELTVGKYWVRLVSQDGLLEWEGEKDVDEGNVNAVEGKLESAEERLWNAAKRLDEAGSFMGANERYGQFIERFPESERIEEAKSRRAELDEELTKGEIELAAAIENAKDLAEVQAFIAAYHENYPGGPNEAKVKEVEAIMAAEIAGMQPFLDAEAAGTLVAERRGGLYQLRPGEKFRDFNARIKAHKALKEQLQAYADGPGKDLKYHGETLEDLLIKAGVKIDTTGLTADQILEAEFDRGDLAFKWQSAKSNVLLGWIFVPMGVTFGIAGLVVGSAIGGEDGTFIGAMISGVAGGTFTLVGVPFMIAGYTQKASLKKKAKAKYDLALTPAYNPIANDVGLTLTGHF